MAKKHQTSLSQIRRMTGKTQAQVAGQLGVSKATYSSWETGRAELGAERLRALCDFFHCTPNDILGYGHSARHLSPLSEEDKRLLMLFKLQPPNMRQYILGIMDYTAKGRRSRSR